MSIRVGLRPMARVLGVPVAALVCEWFSDFEADAVGDVPAGWTEEYGTFRVQDDQAAVGDHSVRFVHEGTQTLQGRRMILCTPTYGRLQLRLRLQGAAERRHTVLLFGEAGIFSQLGVILGRAHFIYYDGAWKDVPNSPSPASNTWYTTDIKADTDTGTWKVIINGNDSGWLARRIAAEYFDKVQTFTNTTYPPTYTWWDEVDWSTPEKRLVFSDDFETWAGWNTYSSGDVYQSGDQYHGGAKSLLKEDNSDPHGGYKALGETLGRGLVFSGWIYRPSVYDGGAADRLAIEDSSFNGYGFNINHGASTISIEKRTAGVGAIIGATVSYNPPEDAWYKFAFYIGETGQLSLFIYNAAGTMVAQVTNRKDTSYTSFDRVVVHGGYQFYVDDIEVHEL